MSAELWGSLLQCVRAVASAWLPMSMWVCRRRPSTTVHRPCSSVCGTKPKGWRGVWKELDCSGSRERPSGGAACCLALPGFCCGCSIEQQGNSVCRTVGFCCWAYATNTVWKRKNGRGKHTRRYPFSDSGAVSGSLFLLTVQWMENSWLRCFRRCSYMVLFWHMWCRPRMSYSARLSGRSFAVLCRSPWSGLLPSILTVCPAFWPKPWRKTCSKEPKSSCFNSALGCDIPPFSSRTSQVSSLPSHRKWRQLALQILSHINFYFKTIELSLFKLSCTKAFPDDIIYFVLFCH